MTQRRISRLLDGLTLPEAPRWHDGVLWFSDIFAKRVMTVNLKGDSRVIAELNDEPSGLGFFTDRAPLVVLMNRRQIVRLNGSGSRVHADLTHIPASFLNDMIVMSDGRAYVDSIVRAGTGDVGSDKIVLVEPDGRSRVAADHERFELMEQPNGLAITQDQKTIIFATTAKSRLSAMSIEADGSLSRPRVFADLPGAAPDGICLDAEGAVWVGGLDSHSFLRVRDGGQVAESISIDDRLAVACLLGGPDRRSLFMLSVNGRRGHLRDGCTGFIDVVTVDVAGVGWP